MRSSRARIRVSLFVVVACAEMLNMVYARRKAESCECYEGEVGLVPGFSLE